MLAHVRVVELSHYLVKVVHADIIHCHAFFKASLRSETLSASFRRACNSLLQNCIELRLYLGSLFVQFLISEFVHAVVFSVNNRACLFESGFAPSSLVRRC